MAAVLCLTAMFLSTVDAPVSAWATWAIAATTCTALIYLHNASGGPGRR